MSANRKVCRAELVTLISTVSTLEATFNGAPMTTGGLSPFATVTDDGTEDGPDKNLVSTNDAHYFLIDLYWLRAPGTEDELADLSTDVRNLLRANRGANSAWGSLELNGKSQLDYVIIDGKDYRLERIPVVVW